jgi:uncharacterized protein (DUF2252 family)
VTGSSTALSSAPTDAGTYDVTATYPGDLDYTTATSTRATFTIGQATPSVVAHAPNTTYNALPYVSATATVTGVGGATLMDKPITFTYYVTGSSTALSSAPTDAGIYDVTATYPGDTDYTTATSSRATFTIGQATPSAVVTAPNAAYTGNPYNAATAAVTGVGGVTITDGTVTFTYYDHGSNTALVSAPTAPGTYDVIATFSGDTDYTSANSSLATFTISNLPTPSVSVTAPNTTYNAEPYSLAKATVTGAGNQPITDGSVTFTYYLHGSTTALSSAPTDAGIYDVTATFSGDANYGPATSDRMTFTIGQATPSVVAHAPNTTYNAQPYASATATVTGIGGVMLTDEPITFTYYVTGSTTALSSAPTDAGTYDVIASYPGDTDYVAAISSRATFMIGQVTPSVVAHAPNTTYNAQPYASATATVTGVAGATLTDESITFTYYVTGSSTALSTAPTDAGTYDVTATYPGDLDYTTATSSRATFTIGQATPSVVAHAPNATFNAQPYASATATVTGVGGVTLSDEPVTFTYYVTGSTTALSSAPTDAGTYDVTATYPGDTDYASATSSRATFSIGQATPSVVAHAPNTTANGQPYSLATATVTGVGGVTLTDEPITFTYYVTGSTTALSSAPSAAGTYDVTATYPGDLDYTSATSSRATFTIAATLQNVTSQLSLKTQTSLGVSGGKIVAVQTVTITNTSGSAISGPLYLALTNLTGETLTNGTGVTSSSDNLAPTGTPYFTVPLTGGTLAAGASVTIKLDFTLTNLSNYGYTPLFLAGSGTI